MVERAIEDIGEGEEAEGNRKGGEVGYYCVPSFIGLAHNNLPDEQLHLHNLGLSQHEAVGKYLGGRPSHEEGGERPGFEGSDR